MTSHFSKKVLAASLVGAVVVGYLSRAGADLNLSRTVWDFESVEQGQSKAQKIVLTNTADQPLKIERIELPQGCSVSPKLENKELKPKEELEVEFTFNSDGILGNIQQYAYVFLTDSTIVPLTIKGEVFAKELPRLQLTPRSWDFRTVEQGQSSQPYTFRCKNVGTADLKLEKIQIYDPVFQVARNITKESLAPGEEVDFAVLLQGNRVGACETDFHIRSNSATGKFTKVTVKGYVVPRTSGVVVSSTMSSVTNNTPFTAEVIRTDKLGKSETLTVERNSEKSFPEKTEPPRPHPADYTLTIKLLTTPPTIGKPPDQKPASEKPEVPGPEPETKPAPEKPPEQQPAEEAEKQKTPAPEPGEEKPSSPQPDKGGEEKADKTEKEKEPAPPSEKEEKPKPPEGPAGAPDADKPSEKPVIAPPTEPPKSEGSGELPKDQPPQPDSPAK